MASFKCGICGNEKLFEVIGDWDDKTNYIRSRLLSVDQYGDFVYENEESIDTEMEKYFLALEKVGKTPAIFGFCCDNGHFIDGAGCDQTLGSAIWGDEFIGK